MLKVLLFGSLIALCAAASLSDLDGSSEETQGCLFQDQLWGSADGTKFYFCLPDSDIAIEQSCSPNTFFVRNATTSGCIPLDMMDPKCVNLSEVGPCTGENLNQPQPASSPSQYYLCPSENATPILLTCPEGKAFYKQDGYLGCFDWAEWRNLADCPE